MTGGMLRVALLAAAALLAPAANATTANYEDWWWNDQQSGHGLNIGQQNDVLFVSWFTYDEAGAGMWLTMSATLAGTRASGQWVRTTGPALGTPFDPAKVTRTVVGTGTLTFGSLHDARQFMATFVHYYNHHHRHSGIGLHTPASVHDGTWQGIQTQRQAVLDDAYHAHPERFRSGRPTTPTVPKKAWINKPKTTIETSTEPNTSPAA
jgi:hypothetical protein